MRTEECAIADRINMLLNRVGLGLRREKFGMVMNARREVERLRVRSQYETIRHKRDVSDLIDAMADRLEMYERSWIVSALQFVRVFK